MSLNKQVTKIGLYALCKNAKETDLAYSLVGGLAVQAHAASQFSNYARQTLDADILVENMTFPKFTKEHGEPIGKLIKNKFGLGYHIENTQYANAVTIMDFSKENKDAFLLHYTRFQNELYQRIKEEKKLELREKVIEIPLSDLNITNENIRTKAKIHDAQDYKLKVQEPNFTLKIKYGRVVTKSNKLSDVKLRNEFRILQESIIQNGMSYKYDFNLDSLFEQVSIDSTTNPEAYNIEKDIFDYLLMQKILN